jgi:hypothetical protein
MALVAYLFILVGAIEASSAVIMPLPASMALVLFRVCGSCFFSRTPSGSRKVPVSVPSRRLAGRYCSGYLVARHPVAGAKHCSRRRCRSSGVRSGSPRVVAAVSARRRSDVGRAQSNGAASSCQGQSVKASEQLSALHSTLAFAC